MSLKMKLTSAIIMFMLIVATLVIGVIAAESQTISMKGNVSFNINDRSLYLKSVRYKVGNDATESVTLENFLPGYIDANMEVNIGDHEFNYSAFTLYFDIVNTTKNTYNAVEEVTLSPELSSQGVTASASGQISPTQETDSDGDSYAEIMPTSEPTGTITLSVTSTSTQAINLGDITITIEQYVPINYSELGYTFSGNSITGYTGTATDLVLPAYYTTDESGNRIEATAETGTPITSISDNAFQNNTTLTTITIPETVTSIGSYAFDGCTNLQYNNDGEGMYLGSSTNPYFALIDTQTTTFTSITINPNCKIIAERAFYYCPSLQSVDFNNCQITEIPDFAFRSCKSLTTITIPETVTSIGSYAFEGCTNLASVTFETESQLQTIGDMAFSNCTSLQSVDFGTNSSLQTIGSSAFSKCKSLTTITIPERVKSIGYGAFQLCSSLTTITIPEGVTSIDDSAFSGCTSLTTITLPKTVTSIGTFAFLGCYALAIVYNNSGLSITAGNNSNGDVGYYAKEVVKKGSSAEGEILIDNQVQYYINGSTKIALAPAVARDTLTTVTLASGTTEINQYAFQSCSSLQTVDFNNCQITSIPERAFSGCTSLTTITIPETVEAIGDNAFDGCTNLQYNNDGKGMYLGSATNPYFALIDTQTITFTSITINSNCKIIADSAFDDCTHLGTVDFGTNSSLQIIGDSAFLDCTYLRTVDFGTNSSLQTIGEDAFYSCSSLTTITIPESVNSIGSSAFFGCASLTTVVIESQYAYNNATGAYACGFLLRYAQTVKVLSTVVEAGTNRYLNNTSNFPDTWTEGEYTVYSKTAQS